MILRSGTELINPFNVLERVGIRERMRVADLGCGALGHFVFPAAQLVGPKGTVYAVDIQREVLDLVGRRAKEERLQNVMPVWSDIDVYRAAHIPDGELDMTLLVNNLFLSQNRPSLVKEMARLTKKGGKVAIIEWKTIATPIGPPSDQRIPKEDATKLMGIPEFSFLEEFDAGGSHYGLLFQRTDATHVPPPQ
ncbi:MAG TPA: methyltransferase domain-containing protein [Candidatus Methylomirabilis sp.]|nr:methyltransferase domain-containing protein [Candidatus Methylomirabilis sp.]